MQSPHGTTTAENVKNQRRSPSEDRAEADIAALEAQLAELEVASKFEECAILTERIEQMKKAQSDILGLKAKREEARASRDFKACAEIQKQIDGLKVIFLCVCTEPLLRPRSLAHAPRLLLCNVLTARPRQKM